jgi:hypothetical protein
MLPDFSRERFPSVAAGDWALLSTSEGGMLPDYPRRSWGSTWGPSHFRVLRKGKCCPIFRGSASQEWPRAIGRSSQRVRGECCPIIRGAPGGVPGDRRILEYCARGNAARFFAGALPRSGRGRLGAPLKVEGSSKWTREGGKERRRDGGGEPGARAGRGAGGSP